MTDERKPDQAEQLEDTAQAEPENGSQAEQTVEETVAEAEAPLLEVVAGAETESDNARAVQFGPLPEATGAANQSRPLDLLLDVKLQLTVELGRKDLTVRDALSLGPGSVVELDRIAGEPVDLFVNRKLIARGEVVVIDENFGIRVTEVVSAAERIGRVA